MKPAHYTEQFGFPQPVRRTAESAADYASVVQRYDVTSAGHRFLFAITLVGCCAVVSLLLAGAL